MAHTPAAPTNSAPASLDLSEVIAFYVAAAGETPTIGSGDLVPLTSGGDGLMPTRTVNRTPLHNMSDLVTTGALQGSEGTINIYVPPTNAKYQLLWNALKSGATLIYNMFYRDGSGMAGYMKVTSFQPSSDPENFNIAVGISTFGVNLIDPFSG